MSKVFAKFSNNNNNNNKINHLAKVFTKLIAYIDLQIKSLPQNVYGMLFSV